MSVPSLLILDLDGTLVDSFSDIEHGIRCALRAIDCPATPALLALCRRGVALESFYHRATGKDPEAPESARGLATFVDTYRDNYAVSGESAPVYAGVRTTLSQIRSENPGTRIAVATSKRTDMARDVVDRAGLGRYLDFVRGSDGLAKKPDPELLQVVARAVERPLSDAVMVGDTDRDVLAAQAAGCRACVGVTYGGWGRAELETLGADRLIDRFSDLIELFRP